MKVFLPLTLALIQLIHFGPAQNTKLSIEIYYESLCPDSIRFMTNQLYPNYYSIRDYVDILFIPFGKSSSINGGESFECQHGPAECSGNRVQSCVLHNVPNNQAAQVEFVSCQMNFNAEPTGESCSSDIQVPWNVVQSCYDGQLGTDLQLEAERLTKAISPSFVPTIVYNSQFDQTLQDRSLFEFKQVVCELLDFPSDACPTH